MSIGPPKSRRGLPAFFHLLPLLPCFLLCWPDPAQALQSHGQTEGIVVHQLAHAVFFLALVGMVLRIYFSPLSPRRSWHLFSRAAILLAVWNLWAFIGHQLELAVPPANLTTGPDREPLLVVDSWVTLFFYLYKLDHCILVPAMIYFYLGLRNILTENH